MKDSHTGDYFSVGLNMAAGMLIFSMGGYWIDQKRGGGQGATITGVVLGLLYCGYETWKLIQEVNANDDTSD